MIFREDLFLYNCLQLLSLFETAMMAPLFAAAEKANAKALMAEDERDYNFLKKLVQVSCCINA